MPNVMATLPNIGGAKRHKVWLTPTTWVPCSNAANIGERRTWMQSELCPWQNSVMGQEPLKMYIPVYCTCSEDGQSSCKVWLATAERRRSTDEAKTWNPLKFVGVPQPPETISAASGPKFAILWGHVEEILLFNKFFYRLSMHALVAKI